MIYDKLALCKQYENAHPLFKIAFSFLREYKGMKEGRYPLEYGAYALVQSYVTKKETECKWECHRRYIDLQFVYSGKETIGVAPASSMSVAAPYNGDKDVEFLSGGGSSINLSEGEFMLLFPGDAHKPQVGDGGHVDKIVIKIPV